MINEINIERPKWIKILIGILSAWVTFMLSITVMLFIILVFQMLFSSKELEGTAAIILMFIIFVISVYFAYRITKWQNKFLDKKTLKINYIVMAILILISIFLIPVPFSYTLF